MIKLAIAEDNKPYLKKIAEVLALENHFQVILEAKNGEELISLLKTSSPHIVIMDIRMPLMNGIEATKIITKIHPSIKIIALTQYDFETNIIEMHRLGAKSVIGKNEDVEELIKAIKIVYDGGTYLTDYALRIIQKYLQIKKESECPFKLTSEEKIVIKELQNGRSSTQIGQLLSKSPRTVEDIRVRLYRKFEVANKEQLILLTARWNIEESLQHKNKVI